MPLYDMRDNLSGDIALSNNIGEGIGSAIGGYQRKKRLEEIELREKLDQEKTATLISTLHQSHVEKWDAKKTREEVYKIPGIAKNNLYQQYVKAGRFDEKKVDATKDPNFNWAGYYKSQGLSDEESQAAVKHKFGVPTDQTDKNEAALFKQYSSMAKDRAMMVNGSEQANMLDIMMEKHPARKLLSQEIRQDFPTTPEGSNFMAINPSIKVSTKDKHGEVYNRPEMGDAPVSQPVVAKEAPSAPSALPKSLDKETALSILSEAKGDKELARKIAMQRGYTL